MGSAMHMHTEQSNQFRNGQGVSRAHRRARRLALFALLGVILCGETACGVSGSVKDHRAWNFIAYGISLVPDRISVAGDFDEGSVTIETTGSGKMVTYGADGLAFYYAELDAQKDNFTLSATVVVDSWTMSNGEDDGFGLMVCDAVPENGDSADFWNNAYMAAVTKVEYLWNPQTQAVSNVGEPIVMRQGIAAREKIGSTCSHSDDAMAAAAAQTVVSRTLESSQGPKGAGTYNIIGNYTPIVSAGGDEHAPMGTAESLLTAIKLEISRDNTGYRIRYIEEDGTVHEQLFRDPDRTHLSAIDQEKIYVGFFVARQARVTFQDVQLTVTDASKDPAPEEVQPERIDPDFRVTSSTTANREDYELVFSTNYAGTLTVRDERGIAIAEDVPLDADESVSIPCVLQPGDNSYDLLFSPGEGADERIVLSDPSPANLRHCVSYRKIGDEQGNIYAAPGARDGVGTEDSPIGLSEAVKYAAPGQTILLGEGVYAMPEPLNIERGHSGTESAPIAMVSNPENRTRPVINFQGLSAGIVLSADRWYLCGFDCTGSASNEYGIHLTGSFNVLENLEIYRNGNTGLHVSSLSLWDDKALWPSENRILNCTSYANCDDAYEDADGFACQFTAGPGNVFDGCVAHHNADDGWDFYAKVWLQPLGPVTIRNCIAYQNGYLEDGRPAGNGNGFKLGGDSMPGGHVVENCLAFENKAAGFTSNSCPDVALLNCTAIDNGSCNIRLSTRNQENTAYVVRNTCSLRVARSLSTADVLQERGTQNEADLRNETAYYWDSGAGTSLNSAGEQIAAQELYVSTEFVPGYSIARDSSGSIILQGGFFQPLTSGAIGAIFK